MKNCRFALDLKKLRTFIRWFVWSAIGLYLLTIVLLRMSFVQHFVGSQVANALSEKLGTKVSVERVDLGMLNHFVVDGVVINDQTDKLMARATRIAAKIDIWTLIKEGKVRITSAQIFGMNAQLYRATPTSKPNFQFVIDSLASRDTTSKKPLDLRIQSLIVRHTNVRYDVLSQPTTRHRLNFNHLDLRNVSGHINLNELTDQQIKAAIRNFSFTEASGLDLKNLRLNLTANRKSIEMKDVFVELPQSEISIPFYQATFKKGEKKPNLNRARHELRIKNSYITPQDLAFLLPQLRPFGTKLHLKANVAGDLQQLNIKKIVLRAEDRSIVADLQGQLKNLQNSLFWNIKAIVLHVKSGTIKNVAKAFHFNLPKEIYNIGDINFKGKVSGGGQNHHVKGTLTLAAGNADVDVSLNGKKLRGKLHTQHFALGNILTSSHINAFVADLFVEGTTDLNHLYAKGSVPLLDYNGYAYRNIKVDGFYLNDAFRGKLSLDDPNGRIYIDGTVGNIRKFMAKQAKINVDAQINAKAVNLHNLRLTNVLGNRSFTFNSKIVGSGTTLDDLIGQLSIDDFTLHEPHRNIKVNHLDLKTSVSLLNKSITLNSDFGTASISGRFNYKTLVQSIKNVVGTYLPAIVGSPQRWTKGVGNNAFTLTANIKNTDLLHELAKVKVDIPQYLNLNATINEARNALDLSLNAPQITYANNEIENLQVDITTQNKGLDIQLQGNRTDFSGRHISLNTHAIARNNQLQTLSSFDTHGKKTIRGQINCAASFKRTRGNLATHLHFSPSKIMVDTIGLEVQPSDLTYSHNNLYINYFELSNKAQHIIINGQASGNPSDSLIVQLKDIDVPYILEAVNFHSVTFDGIASGEVAIKSLFTNLQAHAKLTVKKFEFQDTDMGTLFADADYTHSEGRINVDAKAISDDNTTDVGGYIDIKRKYINLPITAHDTKLDFLNKFCKAFMDNINLRGNGWVKVVGPLSDVNLEGDVLASGSVRLKALGTTYALHEGRVRLIPNEIYFERDTVYDADGNIGIVTGGLHHQALRHLTFDIDVNAKNLMVYNYGRYDTNNTFWGKVYGNGTCQLIGRENETTINVNMEPTKNSFITYNAAKNSIDENSFIRWRDMTPDTLSATITQTTQWQKRDSIDNNISPIASDLHINCLINTNPNFTLAVLMDEASGDNIELNGSGVIRATYYNKGAFNLFGNYNIERGHYNFTIQNIIKRQFAFQPGSLIAFGGNPFDAALSLKGSYILNSVPLSDLQMGNSFRSNNTEVNCLLDINGTPGTPKVTFGLDLPNLSSDAKQMVLSVLNSEQDLNQQVLYLLAVGRFYPQTSNNAAQGTSGQKGQASLVMQSILSGTLSQQINTILSNVIKDNHWNFGANIATGNDGFSNAEYQGILSGSLLNNRLLINGEFGYRDNVATNTSAFIGDFDIKYLLTPSGNIALNFYNRANDRYFTRNSLNTQGIGVIMKKDFTNIWDLFGVKKKKKKKK